MLTKEEDVIRTIRLEPAEIAAALREVSEAEFRKVNPTRRSEDRLDTDLKRLNVTFESKTTSPRTYEVYLRNISPTGICFVHGVYVYEGSRCLVRLRTLDGQSLRVPCVIKRCRFIVGKLHEVGAEFEMPIDLSEFFEPNLLAGKDLHKPASEIELAALSDIFTELVDAVEQTKNAGQGLVVARVLSLIKKYAKNHGLQDVIDRLSP